MLLAKQVSIKDCVKVSLVSVKLNYQVSSIDFFFMTMIEIGLCAQIYWTVIFHSFRKTKDKATFLFK